MNKKAEYLYAKIPTEQKDAFYQLVLHPVAASANLNKLYHNVAKNKLYAAQGRNTTNDLADSTAALYQMDETITNFYNKVMANGKWDHMMDQTHIGYTNWQQPDKNEMPKRYKIVPLKTTLGLAIEGSEKAWYGKEKVDVNFPVFDYYRNNAPYIEVFNAGKGVFKYQIKTPAFVIAEQLSGEITTEKRIYLHIDWQKVPKGKTQHLIVVSGSEGSKITLPIIIDNRRFEIEHMSGFVAENGYVAMEAPSFTRAINSRPIFWKTIPNYGKTTGAVFPVPVSSPIQQLSSTSPHLEYDIYLNDVGTFNLLTYVDPTIDFTNSDGLKFAVSIDDEPPVIVNISADYNNDRAWGKSVADNIKIFSTPLKVAKEGKHTIKYWMVNPAVVLQKLVLDLGGLKPSYLGPPETFVNPIKQ